MTCVQCLRAAQNRARAPHPPGRRTIALALLVWFASPFPASSAPPLLVSDVQTESGVSLTGTAATAQLALGMAQAVSNALRETSSNAVAAHVRLDQLATGAVTVGYSFAGAGGGAEWGGFAWGTAATASSYGVAIGDAARAVAGSAAAGAFAIGHGSANGQLSFALGDYTTVATNRSTSLWAAIAAGSLVTARFSSAAIGYRSMAEHYSLSFGDYNLARSQSVALGIGAVATGAQSFAVGAAVAATERGAVAIGFDAVAGENQTVIGGASSVVVRAAGSNVVEVTRTNVAITAPILLRLGTLDGSSSVQLFQSNTVAVSIDPGTVRVARALSAEHSITAPNTARHEFVRGFFTDWTYHPNVNVLTGITRWSDFYGAKHIGHPVGNCMIYEAVASVSVPSNYLSWYGGPEEFRSNLLLRVHLLTHWNHGLGITAPVFTVWGPAYTNYNGYYVWTSRIANARFGHNHSFWTLPGVIGIYWMRTNPVDIAKGLWSNVSAEVFITVGPGQ